MLDVEQAAADAAFGTDLYTRLAAGGGNLVFSPASVAAALRMALIGARGETAGELAAALHLDTPAEASEGLRQLGETSGGADTTFRASNTMWLDSALSVQDKYLQQPVAVRRCDFARQPEDARRAINETVAEQTAGKISELIPPGLLGALTRLVLVNAVYLNARWVQQFPARQTRKNPFHPERAGVVQVDMMHLDARLAYTRGDGYQAVLLPYRGGQLAMAVVLPDGALSALRDGLGGLGGVAGVLRDLLAADPECQVDLRLPRFTITAGSLLRDTLRSLGVVRAFGDDADFSGITAEPAGLRISEVVHKAYIDVDEEGTEAAAATATAIRAAALVRSPARRVVFTADRPFLFAVVNTSTGLPLFLGQLARPA